MRYVQSCVMPRKLPRQGDLYTKGGGNDEERSGLVVVKKRLKLDASRHTLLEMSSIILFEKRHLQQIIVDCNQQAE